MTFINSMTFVGKLRHIKTKNITFGGSLKKAAQMQPDPAKIVLAVQSTLDHSYRSMFNVITALCLCRPVSWSTTEPKNASRGNMSYCNYYEA